jgi:mycothiol synthase
VPTAPQHQTLAWHAITSADLADLDRLMTAIEDHDELSDRHTVASLEQAFSAPDSDPARDSLLARDAAGNLVAYGWNHPSETGANPLLVHASGAVHPEHRGRGIGQQLIRWQFEAARRWYRDASAEGNPGLRIACYADEGHLDRRRLYARFGLRPFAGSRT